MSTLNSNAGNQYPSVPIQDSRVIYDARDAELVRLRAALDKIRSLYNHSTSAQRKWQLALEIAREARRTQ